jgi:hypothetical protein
VSPAWSRRPSPELRIPALQLKREWSPWPEFGSDPGNPPKLGWCRPAQASLPRSWPTHELRIPNAAAQTRIVSKARIRLDSRKSVRSCKGIICVDISEFESYMPSHAVGLRAGRNTLTRNPTAEWLGQAPRGVCGGHERDGTDNPIRDRFSCGDIA